MKNVHNTTLNKLIIWHISPKKIHVGKHINVYTCINISMTRVPGNNYKLPVYKSRIFFIYTYLYIADRKYILMLRALS